MTDRPLPLPDLCATCGHSVLVHYLPKSGRRMWCTTWPDTTGPCPCLTYTEQDDQ